MNATWCWLLVLTPPIALKIGFKSEVNSVDNKYRYRQQYKYKYKKQVKIRTWTKEKNTVEKKGLNVVKPTRFRGGNNRMWILFLRNQWLKCGLSTWPRAINAVLVVLMQDVRYRWGANYELWMVDGGKVSCQYSWWGGRWRGLDGSLNENTANDKGPEALNH